MLDSFGRDVSYLRVSVTQRCNLNCSYCGTGAPDPDELTPAQIVTIVRAFASLGVDKVRLTGGEPLARKDIPDIAAGIKEISGIKKLALTTNGVLLEQKARELKNAGVDAVNISLDTLDREKFRKITGRDLLPEVIKGIESAIEAGFGRVRINSVLMRGKNDADAGSLIRLAEKYPVDVRFIELMPFSSAEKNASLMIPQSELLSRFPFLVPQAEKGGASSTAKYYTAEGFLGKIGFISPVSDKFCADCNRIRLLSNGKLRPCLGHEKTYDLKACLDDPEKLVSTIKEAIAAKPVGHNFDCAYGGLHAMNKIGG